MTDPHYRSTLSTGPVRLRESADPGERLDRLAANFIAYLILIFVLLKLPDILAWLLLLGGS